MTPDEVMTEYAAAWSRGDADAAFAWYGDDVVMHLPGRSSNAGVHTGKAAVVACIRGLLERTDGYVVDVDVIERATGANSVMLMVRERTTRGGEVLDIVRVNAYRVEGDRIREIRIFEADQYGVDAFFT